MMWTKVGYAAVNIILLIIYACTFGYRSIQKYLDNGIIVVEKAEKHSILPPPCKLKTLFLLFTLTPLISAENNTWVTQVIREN